MSKASPNGPGTEALAHASNRIQPAHFTDAFPAHTHDIRGWRADWQRSSKP